MGYVGQEIRYLSPYIANFGVVGNACAGLVNGSLVAGADWIVNLIGQKLAPTFTENHDVAFTMIKIATITTEVALLNFSISLFTGAESKTIPCVISATVSALNGQLLSFGLRKAFESLPSDSDDIDFDDKKYD